MISLKHVTFRPYPKDKKRSLRVKKEMLNHEIETINDLANKLQLNYEAVTAVVNGTRISEKTEKKIADFFGVDKEYLFPKRNQYELQRQALEQGLITKDEAIFKERADESIFTVFDNAASF